MILRLPLEDALSGAVNGYPMTNAPPSDDPFIVMIKELCECASSETKAMILRVCREIVSTSPQD